MSLSPLGNRRPRGLIGSAIVCLVIVAFATVGFAREPVDERVEAAPDGEVSVENVAGSVHVIGWDKKEVHVEGHLSDEVKRLDIDGDGKGVSIEVVLPRRVKDVGETDLKIHVPKGSDLEVETVSAWIRIEDVHGELVIESVSGSIECSGGDGEVEAVDVETVSGTIELNGIVSKIEAESVSGAVKVLAAGGAVKAATVSGSVVIEGGEFTSGDFESVSGSLRFEGDLVKDGHYEFENLSGSTTLVVPGDVDATFTIESFSGSIKTEFGARIESEDYGPGKYAEFHIGDGDADVEISSFSGSVTINKK